MNGQLTRRILAIDPGYERSAVLALETPGNRVLPDFAIHENADLLPILRGLSRANDGMIDVVVIEQIQYYGMAVGREVFDTVHWAGRFTEAAHPILVVQLSRKTVAARLCNDARAKDKNIRLALIDRFGGPAAIGRKATPGPLYGISKDVWSALAIAVTYADNGAAVV